MSQTLAFARCHMNHSARTQAYESVMAHKMKTKRGNLGKLTFALISADRRERQMDDFITECQEEANG